MYIFVFNTGLPAQIVKTTNPTAFKLSNAVQVTYKLTHVQIFNFSFRAGKFTIFSTIITSERLDKN